MEQVLGTNCIRIMYRMSKKVLGLLFLLFILVIAIFLLERFQIYPAEGFDGGKGGWSNGGDNRWTTTPPTSTTSPGSVDGSTTPPPSSTNTPTPSGAVTTMPASSSVTTMPYGATTMPAGATTTTPPGTTTTPPIQVSGNDLDVIQSFLLARADFTNSVNSMIVFLSQKGNYNDLIQKLDDIKQNINNI
jgi:hypothetical protein